MEINRKNIDKLNAVITVNIQAADYKDQVEKVLSNYKKNANIPGFRKGHIPMGMVKKQFGKAVLIEEVNKLIQEKLNEYLKKEEIDILGNPLPKNEAEIDWTGEDFSFEFELGLAPEFTVDVTKKATVHYQIEADKAMIENQIKTIRNQYGKLIAKDKAEAGDELTGTFSNEEQEIDHKATFDLDLVKGKKQREALVGAVVGTEVTLNTKDLFKEQKDLERMLGIGADKAKDLKTDVVFTIAEINKREKAELNQELFDKLFGPGNVSSEKELKEKIKEDAERQFVQQSDQKLLNDVIDTLIDNTKFDLPEDFLKRWIQSTGEAKLTQEEAAAEYERSVKGLRYQLIEGKLREEHEELQLKFEDLNAYANEMIKMQMMQYGHPNPSDEEVTGIVARIMSNEDEVRRMSEQLNTKNLLAFFKANAKLKTKKVNYEDFIKQAYA
ncbi:MAG: trigger factor [Bacteroidetes bacterium]|jgi:trigger factor|nr:trigger factor [Flavobacteriaceae bacterium]MDA0863975.1 trigger factor [Bacteroidota bacterium]